jgi:hypothetical protein
MKSGFSSGWSTYATSASSVVAIYPLVERPRG